MSAKTNLGSPNKTLIRNVYDPNSTIWPSTFRVRVGMTMPDWHRDLQSPSGRQTRPVHHKCAYLMTSWLHSPLTYLNPDGGDRGFQQNVRTAAKFNVVTIYVRTLSSRRIGQEPPSWWSWWQWVQPWLSCALQLRDHQSLPPNVAETR